MEHLNNTLVTYFILSGFSDEPNLQAIIFSLILLIYLITLGGNLTIVLLVCLDLQLQTPMYFFLANLSIMDMSFVTITLHKVLISFITGDHIIYFRGCMTQMFLYLVLTLDELTILAAMSYDRYVAICNPLQYSIVMNHRACVFLVMFCWVMGIMKSLPYLCLISRFTCYRANKINHFFCDIIPLLKLTCNDTSVVQLYMFTVGIFLTCLPAVLTFISYVFIIIAICRIKSSSGRLKAFYTCSSHLTVVILLYVALFCQYLMPVAVANLNSKKLLAIFNTVAVPVLNPLIYSLKNKYVKSAFRRQMKLCRFKMLR